MLKKMRVPPVIHKNFGKQEEENSGKKSFPNNKCFNKIKTMFFNIKEKQIRSTRCVESCAC